MNRLRILLALKLVCLTALAVPSYIVVDVGTFGGHTTEANGINDAGQVVGSSLFSSGTQNAFIFAAGSLVSLGTLEPEIAEASSVAHKLNSLGAAVGEATIEQNSRVRASLFSSGLVNAIGDFDGPVSVALDINDQGSIVGLGQFAAMLAVPFRVDGGNITILDTLGEGGGATAINDLGIAVGACQRPQTPFSVAVRFDGVLPIELGTLGGNGSYAMDINNAGQIVGWATTPFDLAGSAVLFENGQVIDLGTLPGYSSGSEARAINESGAIVGVSYGPGGIANGHAFLYQDGTIIDLNTLLPENSGWVLTEAMDINESGQIVGRGLLNGQHRGFLLSPPEALAFEFSNFEQPVNDPATPESTFKRGRIVPLKLSMTQNGLPSNNQVVRISVVQLGTSEQTVNEDEYAANADSGPFFKSEGGAGKYSYHLRTDNLLSGKRYRVSATVWAGHSHSVTFAVR